MKNHQEILLKLFKVLDGFKPQKPKLYAHLTEVMAARYFADDLILYEEGQVVKEAFFLSSGITVAYIFNEVGERQIVSIYQAGEIIAGVSFMEQKKSPYCLMACKDAYVLSISYQQMETV